MLKLKKQVMICARTARALTPLALALLLSLLLTVVPSPSFASAEVSYPLTYSGRLVNDLGEPLAGPLALQFYFYDGAGVSAVPLRSTPIMPSAPVPLSDGVFSAQLSLTAADVQEIFADPQREVWIEVRVGEQVFGRQRFSYVPFALRVPVDGETIYFDPADGKLKLKSAGGSGDMLQSIYDPGKNNKIDLAENAEKLGGQLPAYYSNASNITSGTLPVAQVPDLNAGKITSGTLAYARLPVGTSASTIAAGDDARFTDARIPTGAAGGDLSGSYPSPTLKSSATVDADRAVGSDHIKDGAVTTPKIADSAVTTAKIADGAVTTVKLAADSVDSSKILNGTIATGDIADAAITDAKLAGITTAGKVSGSAISSGSLGGTSGFAGTGGVYLQSAGSSGSDLRFFSNNNTNYLGFKAPNGVTSNTTWILPAGDGGSGQVLSTGGDGTLSWIAIPSAPVSSVAGKTGVVTLNADDVTATASKLWLSNTDKSKLDGITSGADMLKSTYDANANSKIDTAETADNATQLGGQAASYYTNASNLATGTLAYARLPVGIAANTVAAGDDTRFTNARTPTGSAGGDLSGSYPNPTLKSSTTVDADRAVSTDHIKDSAITTAKLAGSAVTSGKIANDAVTSAAIANATIVDGDIATNAAIADSKLATISSAGKVSNSATTATSANTASAIVARDASGNFSAGTITASLSGNVTGNLTGNVTGNASSATTASQIQGQAVSSTAPNSGQVLTWSGSAWTAQTPTSGPTTVVSQNANYSVATSDSSKFFLVSGAGTALTLPLAATAGSGFTVTVKAASGYTIVQVTGSDLLDGVNQSKTLGNLTVAQFVSDGSQWYVGMSYGVLFSGTAVACGSNCYTNSSAISAGFAATTTGKLLQLQNGVWVQADGTNVLRVDGSDNWQLALSLNGRSYSSSNLNKLTANLAGRVCPTNVYVDDTNKVATGRCLYYDSGIWAQRLDMPNGDGVSNQTTAGSIRIGARASTAGNWYEGNIQTCAGKGMRLPVLYETSASDPGGTYKPTDASPTPTWSTVSNGVPSVGTGWTWTASATTVNSSRYWVWADTYANGSSFSYSDPNAVRCVVQ